ncbi:metal-dependent amidase/aminoacylase/carboxypeptidase family protein [Paenibacillus endophyticus]|uniref:Metal-dependent amidase/aminoacylase/carboxypeptidase family protein n=1 Tax=Paenibacillus endophyticus TaxID=1294268 RepID=A0A7W5CEK8_9BACL|nr:metal-dependent amidase/aminoacylase/carboxypeptidase family protein [Paenibacillus endophyticus]
MKEAIIAWLKTRRHELKTTYAELHALAEPSWQEHMTTEYLQCVLEEIAMEYESFPGHTGLVAHWKGGSSPLAHAASKKGPIVALRTDIDALWQQVDGVSTANHSCGHDAHMTMALYALKALRAIGFEPEVELRSPVPAGGRSRGRRAEAAASGLPRRRRLFAWHSFASGQGDAGRHGLQRDLPWRMCHIGGRGLWPSGSCRPSG